MKTLRLGTRGSDLALWQARHVSVMLSEQLGCNAEIEIIKTQGDRIQDVAFHKMEGKGFFTKELQEALLDKRVDLVVHSLKDLPTESPSGLAVIAIPERACPADLLLAHKGVIESKSGLGLKPGRVLGTSSLRRAAQALVSDPGITIKALRGNVPTRIDKLRDHQFDAILLAAAGVRRLELNLDDLECVELPQETMLSAPAQGALAIETRENDPETAILAKLHDPAVARCVDAERGLLKLLGGGCHIPLGCLATFENGLIHLEAAFGTIDEEMNETEMVRASASAETSDEVAIRCLNALREAAPALVEAAIGTE
jgi:hydroxymethylbilane synthase